MSGQEKGTFKIDAFKHCGKLDPSYPEQTWDMLAHAIKDIYNNNASNLNFAELYTSAYSMVLHKHGERLYSGLVQTMSVLLKNVAKSVEDAPDDLFLAELNRKWAEHNKALQMIRDILMYMDRTYVPVNCKTPVHKLGLNLWRDIVVHSDNIQARLRETLLELTLLERAGNVIDRCLMTNIIKMLSALGSPLCQEDFVKSFGEASASIHGAESQHVSECCDSLDYVKES